jgi:1-aminocyclopropane-1-carboxylate deaminase
MIAGFALGGGDDRRVIGIDASKTIEQTVAQVTRIANDTAERIGLRRALRPDEITVVDGYAGPSYGIPDEQTVEAIRLVARTEGMLTDPVYEGKSMAGLIGMSARARFPPGRGSSTPTSAVSPHSPRTPMHQVLARSTKHPRPLHEHRCSSRLQ